MPRYRIDRVSCTSTNISDDAVLQRLEAADRLAELLARLQVLAARLEHRFHAAQRLGHLRERGAVERLLELREAAAGRREPRVGGHVHRAQLEVGGQRAVDQRIAVQRGRALVDQEQREPLAASTRAETMKMVRAPARRASSAWCRRSRSRSPSARAMVDAASSS